MTMSENRPRARDLGMTIGVLPPGPLNAITDVVGVRVGHCTVLNGCGEIIGLTNLNELGTLDTPVLLTEGTRCKPRRKGGLLSH